MKEPGTAKTTLRPSRHGGLRPSLGTKCVIGMLATAVVGLYGGIGWRVHDTLAGHVADVEIHEGPAGRDMRIHAAFADHASVPAHAGGAQTFIEINRRLGALEKNVEAIRNGQTEILQALARLRGGSP